MNKPIYKKWWFILLSALVVIYVLSTIAYLSDDKTTETQKEEQSVTAETQKTDDKEDETKQVATEKEDEKTDEKALAAEIDFYKNKLAPQLDELEKEYDRIWTEQWVTTFKSVSDGSVDVYTAYLQMTFIITNYAVLNDDIDKVEGENLSKENKELLKSYKEKLSNSADYRTIAASEAATMFYEGTLYKTSEVENIKGIISTGDGEMMQAMKDRLSIEENLGLIEKEQTKE